MLSSPETNERHFLDQIDRSAGPDSCHPWTGTRHGDGYGLSRTFSRQGRLILAHRRVWEMATGPIPPRLVVFQVCGNRLCCNVAHLQMGTRRGSAAAFLSKIDRSAGPFACHPWTACFDADGYGGGRLEGRHVRAHRGVWQLTYGSIPEGLLVLHRCDNPKCCNPLHLFLGTQADNVHDSQAKGRRPWKQKPIDDS